ncbi:STAS/SEC14 domain-containing protein [Nakamurella sp. YIM 132087]|uniref:STAS/SEC14 domain-containing protein n=1 Tax=Nakamurella alba TaxID=2665158 RepID=A0A7K1FNI8_9ACTN|nr:STAS/SEC14 domain-containing protein [Nakamurella alba]MTD15706.1 STAS/SEC14 domain-containing protein [Nakamurella alba]
MRPLSEPVPTPPVGGDDVLRLEMDADSVVHLSWRPDLMIDEDLARYAADRMEEFCGGGFRMHPLLVDMTGIAGVTTAARNAFGEPSGTAAVALLGETPVDRVMATFVIGVNQPSAATRYFTDRAEALHWLRDERARSERGD